MFDRLFGSLTSFNQAHTGGSVVCTNCGSEIEPGAPCKKCEVGGSAADVVRTAFCTSCGTTIAEGQACPNCAANAARQAYYPPTSPSAALVTDVVGLRVVGYLLDVIPMIVVGLIFGWIPIVGAIIFGVILLCYWLLRDFAGHSLGKMILGLEVVKKDGSPSDTTQRILRNSTIAIGPALLIIPLIGYVLGPVVSFLLIITELVMLLVKKERLGDILAGTTVVKKTAVAGLNA